MRNKWQFWIAIICILTGFFLVLSVKSNTASQEMGSDYNKNDNLLGLISIQENKNIELEAQIKGIRSVLNDYQHSNASQQGELGELEKTLNQNKILAGLEDLTGPGVVVSIDDRTKEAQEAYKAGQDTNQFLIHYYRLLNIVNNLRSAGADAISVNDVRVVTTTDIRCAGDVILVNATRLSPPYVIKAIGNPSRLEEELREGDYFILEVTNFPVSLTKMDEITIAGFGGSYNFTHSKPATAEDLKILEENSQ